MGLVETKLLDTVASMALPAEVSPLGEGGRHGGSPPGSRQGVYSRYLQVPRKSGEMMEFPCEE